MVVTGGNGPGSKVAAIYDRLHHLVQEMAKFGVVGAVAYAVDVAVFNLLLIGLDSGPVLAKTISVTVATVVSYLGNRSWTFRRRQGSGRFREVALYLLFNAIGLGIAVGCVWVSHYLLDFTSKLADNIAANVVGLGLAGAFRFVTYRQWVFTAPPETLSSPR